MVLGFRIEDLAEAALGDPLATGDDLGPVVSGLGHHVAQTGAPDAIDEPLELLLSKRAAAQGARDAQPAGHDRRGAARERLPDPRRGHTEATRGLGKALGLDHGDGGTELVRPFDRHLADAEAVVLKRVEEVDVEGEVGDLADQLVQILKEKTTVLS